MRQTNYLLKSREDGGKQIYDMLPRDQVKAESWQIVALSFGATLVASEITRRYKQPLHYLFTASITAPNNSECVLAKVSETEEMVIHDNLVDSFGIQYDYIYGEANRKHEEKILSNIYKYRQGEPFENMHDQVVLLIDQGCDTGLTFLVAVKSILAMKPKAVYIGVPCISSDILEELEPMVDHIFYLYEIKEYIETDVYYEKFDPVEPKVIEALLKRNEFKGVK